MQTDMEEYMATFDDVERQAMQIAKSQLGSSFSLERSNGFVAFLAAKKRREEAAKTTPA
jgi:hypothetical protein